MNNEIANQLNDLITLNNDRVAGYQKVVADIKDENIDLKGIFLKYAEQSRKFSQELTQIVAQQGEDAETGTTLGGSLHRAWIDVKSVFGGSDRKSILDEAERGEDVIKKAYKDTVEGGKLSGNALEVVLRQQAEIVQDHDVIKHLRDAE
ncbi:MAG: aldehyde dehydrogenase [Pseudopedobacter saltans]|uniref:Aldehyde dehydrogenase n=1 Tax=Pseudopedobacter saltans TaxID=151895 RepID=A0A2W5F1B8_9SPHI|nr:MAG: aldehyde dehydrogenase [Pseudopedobacter saltans]